LQLQWNPTNVFPADVCRQLGFVFWFKCRKKESTCNADQ
jgi:hypothetical protein